MKGNAPCDHRQACPSGPASTCSVYRDTTIDIDSLGLSILTGRVNAFSATWSVTTFHVAVIANHVGSSAGHTIALPTAYFSSPTLLHGCLRQPARLGLHRDGCRGQDQLATLSLKDWQNTPGPRTRSHYGHAALR